MTKRILLILVIVMTVMLVVPSVRAEDSVDCCYPRNWTIVSNSDVKVIKGANTGLLTPYSSAPHAVAAWEPFLGQVDPTPSFWDGLIDYTFTGGADWIWDSYRTVNTVAGDIVYFQRTFFLDGYPTAGTLHITCDNGYEAWLNGHLVGSAQLGFGWEGSLLTQFYVTPEWPTVEHWDVSGLLVNGTNTLIVKAVNEYLGPLDTEPLGTIDTNPAGLIFQLNMLGNTCPPPPPCPIQNMTVVSDSNVKVIKGANTGLLTPYSSAPYAVAAWEPFLGQVDPTPSFWDGLIDYTFTGGADWIWETYRSVHPVDGDIVYFQRDFSISGYPKAGTLYITCDNGYEAWLNGNLVGSAQLGFGWEGSLLTQFYVTPEWPTVEHWDVSGLLVNGTNTLIVKAVNEYLGELDSEPTGTIDTNPAGLIFQLNYSANTCAAAD